MRNLILAVSFFIAHQAGAAQLINGNQINPVSTITIQGIGVQYGVTASSIVVTGVSDQISLNHPNTGGSFSGLVFVGGGAVDYRFYDDYGTGKLITTNGPVNLTTLDKYGTLAVTYGVTAGTATIAGPMRVTNATNDNTTGIILGSPAGGNMVLYQDGTNGAVYSPSGDLYLNPTGFSAGTTRINNAQGLIVTYGVVAATATFTTTPVRLGSASGTQMYYCNGGVSVGNLCRGNGCSCAAGSWIALGIFTP